MFMNALTALLVVIPVLGIMILVHEWGHYIAAKLFGVRVEVFSIGFGKRLFGFRRGETDYRVSLLPLGGYVKMSGENPMDERTGDPREFLSRPRGERFVIALAGPAMNILLAAALLTGVYMVHYEHPVYSDQPAVIGWIEEDSPSARAGLQPNDRIVAIEGIQDPVWDQVQPRVLLSPEQPIEVTVRRGAELITVQLVPEKAGSQEFGYVGWVPQQPLIVTWMAAGGAAEQGGMQLGDEILAIDGRKLETIRDLMRYLDEQAGQTARVTVKRNGSETDLTVTPQLVGWNGGKYYRIGIQSNPTHVDRLGFAAAFQRSAEQNVRYSKLIFELVGKLIQGKLSLKQVDGPIGIARASGQAFRMGWPYLFEMMAAISLNLGIFNLFPIPILDGGVILLLGIESVMRRDISLRVKERIYQAAFVFLVLFAAVVIYNDVLKAVPRLSNYLP
jgi:regulator of sigma E protease